jgi:thiamine biosynthesis lipoprotein
VTGFTRNPMKHRPSRRFGPRSTALVAVLALFTYPARGDSQPRLWTWSAPTMGTMYTVKIVAPGLSVAAIAPVRKDVDDLLAAIDRQMSTYRTDSDLARFNATTSTVPMAVATDLTAVVETVLALAEQSRGAFDPTYYPVFMAWGFGKDGPGRVPSDEELQAAVSLCGYRHLTVPAPGRLQKNIPGLQLNLDAIAPGHAVDRIAALLAGRGFSNIYVDVGGEVYGHGTNPTGGAWRIGIERPNYDAAYAEDVEMIVPVTNRALATSGDYRNFFRDGSGRAYGHIFDPRLARPVTGNVGSVTVLAGNATLADALATTLYVLGPDEGVKFLTNHPGAEALFIVREPDGTFRDVTTPHFPR